MSDFRNLDVPDEAVAIWTSKVPLQSKIGQERLFWLIPTFHKNVRRSIYLCSATG